MTKSTIKTHFIFAIRPSFLYASSQVNSQNRNTPIRRIFFGTPNGVPGGTRDWIRWRANLNGLQLSYSDPGAPYNPLIYPPNILDSRDVPLMLSLAFRPVTTMKHQERGVTLNELIISLAVVGIVAALGLPNVIQMVPNYRLSSTARSLVVHIHRAKLKAVQRGTIYYLDFDLDGDGNLESGGCFLWGDRNGNRHKEHLERSEMVLDLEKFPGVHLQAYPIELDGPERGPNNTKIDAGGGDGVSFSQNRIKFNPNGTCSTGTVYLHNSNGRTYAIRLRFNGLTQLWRHYGSHWKRW